MTEPHFWVRPSWDCTACAQPWPCAQAKEALLAEFQDFPSVLCIYMAGQLHDAIDDMTVPGKPTPPDLYERFLAWVINSATF